MIYKQNLQIEKFIHSEEFQSISLSDNKSLLIVCGDSWTNNLYLDEEHRWPYLLGNLSNYDYVFNLASDYGSNAEIYLSLIKFFTNAEVDDVHGVHSPINSFTFKDKFKNINTIVCWSTPIRDKSETSIMYRPYKVATIPNMDDVDALNSKIFKKYYENWFREEHHSYKTQLYTLFLQEYCKYHNINLNFFMAFTCLVEDSFKGTKWDLREHIDSDKFFGLYDWPNCLQDYLISQKTNNYKEVAPILEMQHFDGTYKGKNKLYKLFSNLINKTKTIEDRFDIISEPTLEGMFTCDGHPGKIGTKLIAELIYKRLKK
jgi:hypothetical protein